MSEQFTLSLAISTSRQVPTITVSTADLAGDAPRVIVLHGLSSRKEHYLEELLELARRGFVATAIDLPLHGAREGSEMLPSLLADDYLPTIQKIIYDTVSDITALLDLWEISSNTVGVYAISAGGLAAHAAAIVEPRIGAIAAIITSPDWLTADPQLRPAPGSPVESLLASLSPVNSPALYAPKALLMLIGEQDDVLSPDGSELLYQRLLPLYKNLGIAERLSLKVFPGVAHNYTPEMRQSALSWLSKNLIKDTL